MKEKIFKGNCNALKLGSHTTVMLAKHCEKCFEVKFESRVNKFFNIPPCDVATIFSSINFFFNLFEFTSQQSFKKQIKFSF